jgi:integration host factor subunit beta
MFDPITEKEQPMSTGLNKSDLITRLAEKNPQMGELVVEDAVRVMLDQMVASLASGKRIEIRGFGSFALHHRDPRVGRNPKTGESVEVAAKAVPHFKPGKALRDEVNSAI